MTKEKRIATITNQFNSVVWKITAIEQNNTKPIDDKLKVDFYETHWKITIEDENGNNPFPLVMNTSTLNDTMITKEQIIQTVRNYFYMFTDSVEIYGKFDCFK